MSQWYRIVVLAPVAGMGVNILAHVIASRIHRGHGQIKCLLYGFILGLTFTLFLASGVYSGKTGKLDFSGYVLMDIISYIAFAYGYFHFVNINIASLRIRILREIIDLPQGLSEKDLLSRYNAEQIVNRRIDSLVSSDQLIEKEGCYFLGKNRGFLALFWIFEILKYIFLGRGNRFLKFTDREN